MNKSLGNVINPENYAKEFGTDALRMGLIAGTANGKDFNFPKEKIIGYKKFANKLWNIARFTQMMLDEKDLPPRIVNENSTPADDKKILESLSKTMKEVNINLEKIRFTDPAETIYQFICHELA